MDIRITLANVLIGPYHIAPSNILSISNVSSNTIQTIATPQLPHLDILSTANLTLDITAYTI